MYRHSTVVNNVARRKRLRGLIGGTNRCEEVRRYADRSKYETARASNGHSSASSFLTWSTKSSECQNYRRGLAYGVQYLK